MTSPLSIAARITGEFCNRLLAEYGMDENDPFLADTLAGATNLPELLASVMREAIACEDQSEAIGARIKIMASRAARLESKAQNLRVQIAWALQEAGMKRIPPDALPEMTVSLVNRRAEVRTPNEAEVPDAYMNIKTVVIKKPNKDLLRQELEAGERFSFAYLENQRPTLTVRPR